MEFFLFFINCLTSIYFYVGPYIDFYFSTLFLFIYLIYICLIPVDKLGDI